MQAQRKAERRVPPLVPSGLAVVEGWLRPDASRPSGTVRRLVRERYAQYVEGRSKDGLSPIERQAAALRVAVRAAHPALVEDYRPRLDKLTQSPAIRAAVESGIGEIPERLALILRFADRLASDPHAVRLSQIRGLQAQGLSVADIAALARLVAFVTYQATFLDGIDLTPDDIGNEEAPEAAARGEALATNIQPARNNRS